MFGCRDTDSRKVSLVAGPRLVPRILRLGAAAAAAGCGLLDDGCRWKETERSGESVSHRACMCVCVCCHNQSFRVTIKCPLRCVVLCCVVLCRVGGLTPQPTSQLAL